MTQGLAAFTDRRNTAPPPASATPARWTEEEKQRLRDLLASGMTRKRLLASMPGRSVKAVETMIIKLGFSHREQARQAREAREAREQAARQARAAARAGKPGKAPKASKAPKAVKPIKPKHQPQKQQAAPRPETESSKARQDQRPAKLTGIPFPDAARPRLILAARSLRLDGPQPYCRLCSKHRLSWSDFMASNWFDVCNGGLAYLTTAGEIALSLEGQVTRRPIP